MMDTEDEEGHRSDIFIVLSILCFLSSLLHTSRTISLLTFITIYIYDYKDKQLGRLILKVSFACLREINGGITIYIFLKLVSKDCIALRITKVHVTGDKL